MNKQDIIVGLEKAGIKYTKVKFYTESPYMKNRYKPEFITPEAWVYTPNCPYGYVITQETWDDVEYRNGYLNMMRQEVH